MAALFGSHDPTPAPAITPAPPPPDRTSQQISEAAATQRSRFAALAAGRSSTDQTGGAASRGYSAVSQLLGQTGR